MAPGFYFSPGHAVALWIRSSIRRSRWDWLPMPPAQVHQYLPAPVAVDRPAAEVYAVVLGRLRRRPERKWNMGTGLPAAAFRNGDHAVLCPAERCRRRKTALS